METYSGDTPLTRFLATQTAAQLKALRSEYKAELAGLSQRAEDLEADLVRIEQALQERGKVRAPKVAQGHRVLKRGDLPLREAILEVMRARPGVVWDRDNLLAELVASGNSPGGANPRNTLGNRLIELEKGGHVRKVDRGTFEFTAGGNGAPAKATVSNRLFIGSADGEAKS